MTTAPVDIVIIGGNISAAALLDLASKSNLRPEKDVSITVIQGCAFLEWSMAATYFLANPDTHAKFLSEDPTAFEYPKEQVKRYVYSPATGVNSKEKIVMCANGEQYKYSILVVATGYNLPLLAPRVGMSLVARKMEIQRWGRKLNEQGVRVVINGAGSIAIELAADIKLANPSARVQMISRDGSVLRAVLVGRNKKIKFARFWKPKTFRFLLAR
ncbi:unnamed protein product [Amoebophrya sp. A25]|nr:unnamed protein product [Amoebophrya sp. A25]|eukprot:GSA25T00014012001.1